MEYITIHLIAVILLRGVIQREGRVYLGSCDVLIVFHKLSNVVTNIVGYLGAVGAGVFVVDLDKNLGGISYELFSATTSALYENESLWQGLRSV